MNTFYWGTGRRKTSTARVRIKPGTGQFIVNNKPVDDYFAISEKSFDAKKPLVSTKSNTRYDVYANVRGGGLTGQVGAIVMGLARALVQADSAFEPVLRDEGFLTRDPRMVERKKYGKRGARRSYQFSKR